MKNETTKIRLYGAIGGMFGYSPSEIMSQIPADAKNVDLHIHSPGGVVGDGIALYHALKDHPARIRTIIDGDCHSIASIVFLAGDVREAYMSSRVLVHNAWTQAEGEASELRKVADLLDSSCEAIIDIYASATGMKREELQDLMNESRFMRGAELVEKGFATALVNDPEAENQIAAMLRLEQEAHEIMSATNKLKTAMERAEAAEAAIAGHVAEVETIKAELETFKSSGVVVTAELDAIKADYAKAIEQHGAEIASMKAMIEASKAEHAALVAVKDAEILAVTERATKAELALAQPHMIDAVVAAVAGIEPGTVQTTHEGAVVAAPVALSLWEQYNAIADSKGRAKFWKQNQAGLQAESARTI